MTKDVVSFSVDIPRADMIRHAKNPCFVNWMKLAKKQSKTSICDRCPFRDRFIQFINENPGNFTQNQMDALHEVKGRWR